MRILHVTHNYPRWPGDYSGIFIRSLAREQVALGHEVTVLAPHAASTALREAIDGVEVRRYRYGTDDEETLAYTGAMHEVVRRSWSGRWRLCVMLFALVRATRVIVRELGPDIVHVHWWFPNGLAVWPLRPGGAVPTVITVHGTDVFLLSAIRALRPVARLVLRSANGVSAVSSALAQAVRTLGVDVARVLPMPLDWSLHGTPRPEGAPASPGILFVGRLSTQKGVDVLLHAVASLVGAHPSLRLRIVGDGAERERLERLASELGLHGMVEFLGRRTPEETAELYRAASVLAIPSTTGALGEREGFGLVAVEGMLAGLPVVATGSGGLVDIVEDGRTGVLVPERDAPALAAALRGILDDPAAGFAMGARGRATALARFAPATLAADYISLYEQARERARAPSPRR